MGRIGCILMAFGFLAAWLVPVVGAFVMVVGGIVTAIASERAILPEFVVAPAAGPEPGIVATAGAEMPSRALA